MIQGMDASPVSPDPLVFLSTWLKVLILSSQSEHLIHSIIKTVDHLFLKYSDVSFPAHVQDFEKPGSVLYLPMSFME